MDVPEDGMQPARRGRHASILDVASLAGVSPSTVSRSLRGHSSVSAETRKRVAEAARELSYAVSPFGSGLASGRTMTIGVIVPSVTRWFYSNAVAGVYDVLRDAGYDVLIYHLGDAEARDRFFGRMPFARRVDAVVALALPLDEEHTLALRALDLPIVTVGALLSGVSCVRIDDREAGRLATRHLIHQGHEEIVMIADGGDRLFGFFTSAARRAGYREAMVAAGLEPRDDLYVTGANGIEGGAQIMSELLTCPRLPTAVVAEYDELAIGAMRVLRRSSIPVPARISLVGIDDHEMASVVGLTTIAQPVQEQGAAAARLLLDTLDGQRTEPVDVVLPTHLVIRESTGPPFTRS